MTKQMLTNCCTAVHRQGTISCQVVHDKRMCVVQMRPYIDKRAPHINPTQVSLGLADVAEPSMAQAGEAAEVEETPTGPGPAVNTLLCCHPQSDEQNRAHDCCSPCLAGPEEEGLCLAEEGRSLGDEGLAHD